MKLSNYAVGVPAVPLRGRPAAGVDAYEPAPPVFTQEPYFLSIFWMWLTSQSRTAFMASTGTDRSPPAYRRWKSCTLSMNRRCASFCWGSSG